MELRRDNLLTWKTFFLNRIRKTIAAIPERKNEICIEVRVISLMNKPPVLQSNAVIKTALIPFVCSERFKL